MNRYIASVSYKGSNYHGWARQQGLKTIQGEIEKACCIFFDVKSFVIFGSSRTDAGVHAKMQIFHFDVPKANTISVDSLKTAINNLLPYDIHVNKIKLTNKNFNARYSTVKKTYIYKINTKQYNTFENDLIYQYNKKINVKQIRKAAKLFCGTKDFLSYCTEKKKDNVRTIHEIKITKSKNIVQIKITGSGFLRNMVRMIVGSLLALNENKITLETIEYNLKNPAQGKSVYKSPGCGLYLNNIEYKIN